MMTWTPLAKPFAAIKAIADLGQPITWAPVYEAQGDDGTRYIVEACRYVHSKDERATLGFYCAIYAPGRRVKRMGCGTVERGSLETEHGRDLARFRFVTTRAWVRSIGRRPRVVSDRFEDMLALTEQA
jgi:hypothetical protein